MNTLNVKNGDARTHGPRATVDSVDTQYCPGSTDFFGKDGTDTDPAFFGQRLGGQVVFGPDVSPSDRWTTQLALDTGLGEVSTALEAGLCELRSEIAKLQHEQRPLDRGSLVAGESSVGPLTLLKLEVTQLRTELSNMRRQLNCLQDWQNGVAAQPRAQEALDAVADLRADLELDNALAGPMSVGRLLPMQGNNRPVDLAGGLPMPGAPTLPPHSPDSTAWPLPGRVAPTQGSRPPVGAPALPPNCLDFTVQLDRGTPRGAPIGHGRRHAPLGMTIDCSDGSSLHVDGVGPGVVKAWNDANPTWAVRSGDRIIAVNGLAGNASKMMESAAQSERVALTIRRYPPPPPPLPADARWLPPLEESGDISSEM